MVTNSSIILFVVARDLCMTSLFAVTNVMCKVAARFFVLILVHCWCDFIFKVLICIRKFGLFNFYQVSRQSFPTHHMHKFSLTTSMEIALTCNL